MKEFLKCFLEGYVTYAIGILIILLGVYQFFKNDCNSGLATILMGAGFMGVRRAIENK
jgi:membrane-bound ClpP family serine protease